MGDERRLYRKYSPILLFNMRSQKFTRSAFARLLLMYIAITVSNGLVNDCNAQTEIPKKTNMIIVSNDSSQQANLHLVVTKLLDEGYEPAEINKDYFTIKTAMRDGGNASADYYLFIRCKDKEIIITSKFISTVIISLYGAKVEQSLNETSWVGEKGGSFKRIFVKMDAFAKSLGGKISYSIQ